MAMTKAQMKKQAEQLLAQLENKYGENMFESKFKELKREYDEDSVIVVDMSIAHLVFKRVAIVTMEGDWGLNTKVIVTMTNGMSLSVTPTKEFLKEYCGDVSAKGAYPIPTELLSFEIVRCTYTDEDGKVTKSREMRDIVMEDIDEEEA